MYYDAPKQAIATRFWLPFSEQDNYQQAIDKCNELQHLNVLIDEIKAMEIGKHEILNE